MHELPPNSDEETTETDPGTVGTASSKSRHSPSETPEPTLQGKKLELDLRIYLSDADAMEQLNQVHRELGSPPEAGESETVTPEDERALEAAFAEHDTQQKRAAEIRKELFGADASAARAIDDAALELLRLLAAGFTRTELERLASSFAETIAKQHANEDGSVSKEATLAYLKRRYEPYYKEVPDDDAEEADPTKNAE